MINFLLGAASVIVIAFIIYIIWCINWGFGGMD